MEYAEIIGTSLPQSDSGDPDCCGCLNGLVRGDHADIVRNECSAVIRTVSVPDLRRTLDEMEISLEVATEKCPHCGAVQLALDFQSCWRSSVINAVRAFSWPAIAGVTKPYRIG
jgi:hypothetical protein